jgi:hypothetical protein
MKSKTAKQRITWGFSPVSRTVPSKKRYSRIRVKAALRREAR